LPDVKFQNCGFIQDGVESVFIFHPIFSKMIIFQFFLLVLGKIKLLSEKSKMEEKFYVRDDFFLPFLTICENIR
jgi:hypothetical protein